IASAGGEPRVSRRVEPGIIGIQINETTLDEKVANLEHIAPSPGMRHACAPRSIEVLSRAGSLDSKRVPASHDPVEGRVIVEDVLDEPAEVCEQLSDLFLACGEAPFWKEDLSILGN